MMLTPERSELVIALCQALIQRKSYSGHEDGVERMKQAFERIRLRRSDCRRLRQHSGAYQGQSARQSAPARWPHRHGSRSR
jgi:hypothetical protein